MSGSRGTQAPVPLYRMTRDGVREPIAVDIANPTSLAWGPDGRLYVSSRFDGQVYRLGPDDHAEMYATELGVATGLAFSRDGHLFVGDRSGTILGFLPTGRSKRLPRFLRAWPHFIWRSGPTIACMWPRPRCPRTTRSIASLRIG